MLFGDEELKQMRKKDRFGFFTAIFCGWVVNYLLLLWYNHLFFQFTLPYFLMPFAVLPILSAGWTIFNGFLMTKRENIRGFIHACFFSIFLIAIMTQILGWINPKFLPLFQFVS